MEKKIILEKGFLHDKVPFKIYKELLDAINVSDVNSKVVYNSSLAGNMESEFNISNIVPYSFYEYLASLANSYYQNFPLENVKAKKNFEFMDCWLNYQKKYEFNPSHLHYGSLSYVVWIKIPYSLAEELSLPNSKYSNNPRNSLFEFSVMDSVHTIHVDSSMEGEIIIFDSTHRHQVYPFYTSDEYRISLAGNLKTTWVD